MNNDEYDYGHNVSNYHSDGEGDLEEIINATSTDMKVRIKKLCPEAKIPVYAHPGDAGMDLYATSIAIDEMCNTVYGTGIAVEIPEGYVGLVFPRSSNAKKTLWLTNHVGVIDSGYRGEIKFKFRSTLVDAHSFRNKIFGWLGMRSKFSYASVSEYKIGDKIGQLIIIPYPKIEFEEVEFLFPGDRGCRGYGSSGE